jgi:phage terminase small subunit
MKTGRRPKPTASLKLHGTYREDRHAERADAAPPHGAPVKPSDLGEIESALWDQVVPDLTRRQLVGASETAELVSLCELWGLYRKTYALARVTPTDKEVRCAVTAYWTAFDRVASKFGLTSADKANIKAPKPEGPKGLSTRSVLKQSS